MYKVHSTRAVHFDQFVCAGIYGIICEPNQQLYVGCSDNILKRWTEHITRLNGGWHERGIMAVDYSKYGPGQFVFFVIERVDRRGHWADTLRAKLCEIERFYIYVTSSDVGESRYNVHGSRAARNRKKNPYDHDYRRERWESMTDDAHNFIEDCLVMEYQHA